jgi:hypothetical protein
MGNRARHVIETQLSKPVLCGAFCDVLERGLKNSDAKKQDSSAGESLKAA